MDALYAVTLAPLELLYKWFYLGTSALFGSMAAGLFALSCLNAFILIPLTKRVGFIQDAESTIQGILAPQIARIKGTSTGAARHERIRNLYARYGYHPLFALRSGLGVFLQLPFLFAAFNMLNAMPLIRGVPFWFLADLGQPDGLLFGLNLLPFLMTTINLGVTFTSQGFDRRAKIQAVVIALAFLALLYPAPSALLVFWTTNNLILLLKNLVSPARIHSLTGKLLHGRSLHPGLNAVGRSILARLSTGHDASLYAAALACLTGLLALFAPTALFLSDPGSFDSSLGAVLRDTLPVILAGAFALFFLWLLVPSSWQGALALLSLFMACAALAYAFIPLADYGALDMNTFDRSKEITRPGQWTRDLPLLLAIVLGLGFTYKKRYTSGLRLALWCFSLVFLAYAGYGLATAPAPKALSADRLPPYSARLMSHARHQGNVLVVMLDEFTGGHMERLLQDDPTLAARLDGFAWYPDALAYGNLTIINLAPLYGGPAFAPLEINKRRTNSPQHEQNRAFTLMPNAFTRQGYDVSLAGLEYYDEASFRHAIDPAVLAVPEVGGDYVADYEARTGTHTEFRAADRGLFLSLVSLFRSAPYSLRRFIYTDGQWMGTVEASHAADMTRAYHEMTFLDALAHHATADSPVPTLKIIYSGLTHGGWFLKKDSLELAEDPYPAIEGQHTKVDGIIPEHYYTEAHALRLLLNYFDWMRREGIYDTTTIVLVSDHGFADSPMMFSALELKELGFRPDKSSPEGSYQGRAQALFMVKEPGSRGPLRTDPTLVSNADVASFICERINGCDTVPRLRDILHDNAHRTRTHTMTVETSYSGHYSDRYLITNEFTVTGTMFKKDNWREVTPK